MRALLVMIFLVVSTYSPAKAGPWLRETGTSFTAVTFGTTYYRDIANTTYLEYGLRDDLTLGADIGTAISRFGTQTGYGTIFIRKPLSWGSEKDKWAYEIGIGTAWINKLMLPHIKTGLSWGRGITLGEKTGWMTVDASVRWDLRLGNHMSKVDTTLGLNFTEQTAGMMQVFISHLDGGTYGTVAPSLVIKPKTGKFRIQFGAEVPLESRYNSSLKIGIWRSF